MELFCENCQYAISAEEAQLGIIRTKEVKNGKLKIEIECPKCGHINSIFTK